MALDPQNDFRPGDDENVILRKILSRLPFVSGGGGGGGVTQAYVDARDAATLLAADTFSTDGDVAVLATVNAALALRELLSNKSNDVTMAANSATLYPTQHAAKIYTDTGLATKQNSLGFTAENVANKSIDGTLAANSDTLYPSQRAVKTYADTKQPALGFTAENVANKSNDVALTADSATLYPTQHAVKSYADTKSGLAVLKAGSNMTGNLTLGTTAIVLQTDGVASFSGQVSALAGVNVPAAQAYSYDFTQVIAAQTGLNNFFFGPVGNFTMVGNNNLIIGSSAFFNNDTGTDNTVMGTGVMANSVSSSFNVGIGSGALALDTAGMNNIAIGFGAQFSNDTGASNIGIGTNALATNFTGIQNIAVGEGALNVAGGNGNVAVGVGALAFLEGTGDNNIGIGTLCGGNLTAGTNNIIVGNNIFFPDATGSNQLVIGNLIFATGIDGTGTTIEGFLGVGTNAPIDRLSVLGNFGVYNVLTSDTNYERLSATWASNICRLWTDKGSGGGSARALSLGCDGTELLRFGSATTLGFFAATPVVKQTSGANLTNSVTAGGTTDTITDWTGLALYVTDAPAIRNAVYQLARKLKQVNDALRAYGLLT